MERRNHVSLQLHERVFILFTCDHSAATDFTHEALRLFEEEAVTTENAHRLKDEKAHALLWHYICNVEKKLQEVRNPFLFCLFLLRKWTQSYLCFLVSNRILCSVVNRVNFHMACFVSGYRQGSGATKAAWAAGERGRSHRNQWFGIWEQAEGSGQQLHLRGAVF